MRMKIKTERKLNRTPLHRRLGLRSKTLHTTVRKTKSLQVINGNLQDNVKKQTCKQIRLENYNLSKQTTRKYKYTFWLEWATIP